MLGYIGAVVQKEDLDLDEDYTGIDHESYFMDLYNGSLFGSGRDGYAYQGDRIVKVGDRVGVLVGVGEQGFVRYFHNGKERGPGYRSGEDNKFIPTGEVVGPIKSPLVIAVHMKSSGQSYELLQASSPAAM